MVADVVEPAHHEHPIPPEEKPCGEQESRERGVLFEACDEGHLNVLRRHPRHVVLKGEPVLGEVGKKPRKKEKEERSEDKSPPPRAARGRKRKNRTEGIGHEEFPSPLKRKARGFSKRETARLSKGPKGP